MTSGRGVARSAARPVGPSMARALRAACGCPALVGSSAAGESVEPCEGALPSRLRQTRKRPRAGAIWGESMIGRDRRGPSMARALRAACGCLDSLPANQSNPARGYAFVPLRQTQKRPHAGAIWGESMIGRDRRGPSMARALRAACGCPDSLPANQSNPARGYSSVPLRQTQKRPHAGAICVWRRGRDSNPR